MKKFTTPMMQQYQKIKSKYSDCLLFFRLGDFYEFFLDDAKIGSEILGITLTSRPKGRDGRIPMAGVPFHAVDNYIGKLIKAGYKVAICEQISEPDKYGIVEREVVRVITPGTVLDEKILEKRENNYLVSLFIDGKNLSISTADISTGYLQTMETTFENLDTVLDNELSKINPTECILSPKHYNNPQILKALKRQKKLNIYLFKDWNQIQKKAHEVLTNHFGVKTLLSFGIEDKPNCIITSATLIQYLKNTQKNNISHIKKIITTEEDSYVSLDRSTIINLEIFSTIREHDTNGSLLSILDHTSTPMGGRMLKNWLKRPLRDKKLIEKRLDSVEEFLNSNLKNDLREELSSINDIERILSRLCVDMGNPRDMINLKESLKKTLVIKHKLINTKSRLNQNIQKSISADLHKLINLIDCTIIEEPPVSYKDGGIIKEEVDESLDNLKKILHKGKKFILDLEEKERKKTGINSLKIKYNQVFGFFIEVSKANLELIPSYFERRQTLASSERFITNELKSHEENILISEEESKKIEERIYQKVLLSIKEKSQLIQKACHALSSLDCILNFSHIAEENNYTRPKLIYSGELKIKKGRHPVVEKLLDTMEFVPNDMEINNVHQQLLIITGPNMAGKSVYIRSCAIIVLMAQIGSFVPAQSAYISIVDKIFVRSGASDVITSGLSTFMVEMVETAYILNHATKDSLIIMDEIGRGTSTYDGISIAWAVAEFLVKGAKPSKTLFATHYHELQKLEDEYPKKIRNYHLEVKQENGLPIFLHTIARGGAPHSFGIAVAKLAGIPDTVISKAYQILENLESRRANSFKDKKGKLTSKDLVVEKLHSIKVDNMTPIEALNFLSKLKNDVEN